METTTIVLAKSHIWSRRATTLAAGLLVLFLGLTAHVNASHAHAIAAGTNVIESASWYNKSSDFKRIRSKVEIVEPAVVKAKWYVHFKRRGKTYDLLLGSKGSNSKVPAGNVNLNTYLDHDAFNDAFRITGRYSLSYLKNVLHASMIMRVTANAGGSRKETVSLTRKPFDSKKVVSG